MKRWIEILRVKKWIAITIIGVVVLGLGGFLLRSKLGFATKTDKSDKATADIKTTAVERGDIAVTIDATGTIKPLNIVQVNSKASGKILELTVDEGDYVEKGDVIARIETTYVQVEVDQAEADLKSAQARLEQAKTNIQLQKEQSQIQVAQAEESLAEARKRLEQLTEQIRIEKQANVRQVADATNSLKMAELRYKLQTSETVREEEKKRAESAVKQSEASRDLAEKEYERKKGLFGKKFISKSDLDAAETQWKSAEAQYQSAQEQAKLVEKPASEAELALSQAEITKSKYALEAALEQQIEVQKYRDMELDLQQNRVKQAEESLKLALANRAQITLKEKDLESAKAQLRRSEVQLTQAKERFNDTIITAPISGTILEKMVEEGQVMTSRLSSVASSEGTTLVTMADLSKVYVVTDVDETDIGKVQVGQTVKITVEAYPDQPFEGEVLKIAPQGKVVQNVTTFEVTTELKNVGSSQRGRWGGGSERRRGQGEGSGFPGRGDGQWQRGEGSRAGGESITLEQRERWMAMRRQGQSGDPTEASSRGVPGRGDGQWQRGEGNRAGGESITPEQRERWMAMRRQGQGGDTTEASPRTAASETAPAQSSSQPPRKSEGGDPFNDFLNTFVEGEKAKDEGAVGQASEKPTLPFLKPGMNATVEISAASKQGVLLLPNEAVLSMGDRKMARVIGEDGQPGRPQPIVTGIISFDKTEVISGLEEGQLVALGGFQRAGGGGGNPQWQQMMRNPASTMRRMQGGFPGGRGGAAGGGPGGGGRR